MGSAKQFVLPYLLVLTNAMQGVGSAGNLAMGKGATQKSTACHTYNGDYYCNLAWRAVDGLIHTNYPDDGCTSTADSADTDAWWMVDLGRVYVITNITVYSRRASYHRLRDFWIRVGNSSDLTQHADCTYKSGWIGSAASETFTCDRTLSGRWVSIQRTNDLGDNGYRNQGYLQLCEVQIYGYTAMATTPDIITTDGRSSIGFTTDTRQSTISGPEITQAKVYGWPVSAVATSVVLGILLLTVVAVYVIIKVRKTYTCIPKEAIGRKESAPVSTGSIGMSGLGHGEDYEFVQPAGTQTHSAGNYKQEVPVHHQSPGDEGKKYETLNSQQMMSQEPKTYESLGK